MAGGGGTGFTHHAETVGYFHFQLPEYFTSSTGFPLIFPAENVKLYGSGSGRSSNQLWRYFFQAGKLGAGGMALLSVRA
jgi:hypothetical protein